MRPYRKASTRYDTIKDLSRKNLEVDMAQQYYADVLDPERNRDASLDKLAKILGPLYVSCWKASKTAPKGAAFDLNIVALSQMWFNGSLKLFVLYTEQQEPVGFLIGIVFRPMTYNTTVFQIEDVFCSDGHRAGERVLKEHAINAMRYIGCSEIWAADGVLPESPLWKPYATVTLNKYSRFQGD